MTPLDQALSDLRERGHLVERCEFPPAPLPGLYNVDGREFTEAQVINFALSGA